LKPTTIAAALLFASSLALTSCGESDAPADQETDAGIPGLTVTDGRMVLNAVEGNPAAVYFNLDYEGDRGLSLRKADVDGADMAMIHEYAENQGRAEMMEALPIVLQKGTKVSFEPGGRHVMAMGVSPDLKSGGTTNVTLTVSGGGTQTFPVKISAAGE